MRSSFYYHLHLAVLSDLMGCRVRFRYKPDEVVMAARGMFRVIILLGISLTLMTIVYFTTAPEVFAQPNLSTFTNHDDETTDWSYGVIVDAGSTGSRLFLYKWKSVSEDHLIDIQPALDENKRTVVKKANPGLSTFAQHPQNATEYFRPLLDYALKYVPEAKQAYTPIFIFATAGMRLLPINQQEAIMKELHTNLPRITPMQVLPAHIKVIEGKWEGIYSWVAVNFILGRFDGDPSNAVRKPTVGMIDVGGASLQVAVELTGETAEKTQGDAIETVNLGYKDDSSLFKYRLFVTTFLGYGVNEGLRKYEESLSDEQIAGNDSKPYVRDACLPTNLVKNVERKDGSQFVRKGVGNWSLCESVLDDLIVKSGTNKECSKSSCYLGQVPSPPVSLSEIELYGFSEAWFSMEDVLALGGVYNYTSFSMAAHDFCDQRWSAIQSRARKNLYPKADEERLRSQCFKSAWLASVLHKGFSLDKNKNRFRSVYDIHGEEVQWTIGAMVYHMRYFPLRDMQHREWQSRNRGRPIAKGSPSWDATLVILLVAIVISALVWQRYRQRNTRGQLRRETSMWGYMMLSQDQLYPTQYKTPSFS